MKTENWKYCVKVSFYPKSCFFLNIYKYTFHLYDPLSVVLALLSEVNHTTTEAPTTVCDKTIEGPC